MKIHHLNCGTLRPLGARLLKPRPRHLVCHCLLLESNQGLVLIDSGLGLQEIQNLKRHSLLRNLLRPRLREEESALRQVEALGFQRDDVKHIILTHMDPDHIGGIRDFPNAKIHVFGPEFVAALTPATIVERYRYQKHLWAHSPQWVTHHMGSEQWFGFDCITDLPELPEEIVLVPLPGHSLGHCGVAIRTSEKTWLFHTGDAYFYKEEMNPNNHRCPLVLDLFQKVIQVDGEERLDNQERLRELLRSHRKEITVFSAHDPEEFAHLAEQNPR